MADTTTKTTETQKTRDSDETETRKVGRNSNGDPAIYPSDVESVARQYNLTDVEAERMLLSGDVSDKNADAIKAERVVYRPHMEYVAGADSNPLSVADRRQADNDALEAQHKDQADVIALDPASPAAGPYGPNAEYTGVDAPVDKDHAPVVTETVTRVIGEES